jgi:hypothetical protein
MGQSSRIVAMVCFTLSILTPPLLSQQSHEDQINTWHTRRLDGLKREHNWLSLIALDWLTEGSNQVKGFGAIILSGENATFQPDEGVTATIAGKEFQGGELKTDAEQGGPAKVESGSKAFVVIKRGNRHAIRMWDAQAKERLEFRGIDRFPVSSSWRMTARWDAYATPKKLMISTVIPDYQEEYTVFGAAVFTVGGKEYRLEPVQQKPTDALFFIFNDETNGPETYGAGRFLYADPPKDGMIDLDFNKSINPPCAFSPYATCPLPPKENQLPIRVDAGEKKYGHH